MATEASVRIHAHGSKQAAQTELTKASSPNRINLQAKGSSQKLGPLDPVQELQRKIGNQAVQRLLSSGGIQAKLQISQPGDAYEREADNIADTVMRMPAQHKLQQPLQDEEDLVQAKSLGISTLQRQCADCAEEALKREELDEEEMLHRKPLMRKATGGDYTASPPLASQLQSTKGGGHALPAPTLAFMNRAFGTDFSNVRIHTGGEATEMSRAIQANAFTHGADIYFNAGKYNTTTPEGNKLLAHELTHTLQQSANGKGLAAKGQRPLEQRVSGTAEVIQRDMGLEFQARNVISKNKGATKFERVQTKNKPLRTVGDLSMEVDTGSVMEFGTGHYKLWSDLKRDLDGVSAIITEITALPQEALDPAKAVAPENPLVYRGFKSSHGKVDITVEPTDFHGKPQSNEDIVLSEFGSMLKENRPAKFQTVQTTAQKAFGNFWARVAASPDFTNFMQLIIYHLSLLQRTDSDLVISNGKIKQPKAFLTLMNKTDYTAMFQSLSQGEQKEFEDLVNANPNPIATAAGVSMKDDLFKVGYWGWHPDGHRILIQQGKIVMIQKEIRGVVGKLNPDIHNCSDKGVPASLCKTKTPIEHVTVGAWLKSMITPSKRTKRSITAPLPTYSGSKKGGFSWGLSKQHNPGMFLMEMRGYDGMAIADWPDFAENKFNFAANCRPGSQLTYDGNKPKPKC